MGSEVLVQAERVRKKFCRSLKRSLWYGVTDVIAEAMIRDRTRERLRPHEFWAVDDVSFELKRGECLGLIGANGAGKTTLLKMLNGLTKPDVGRITLHGRVGGLIALGAGFNPILTGRENIYVNASVVGLSKAEIDRKYDEIVAFADLREFIDMPVQHYSSGMAVRLGFAVAAAIQPDILLLDEVLAVGDVAFQAKCFNRLSEMRRLGTAFILVSHNTHHIARYCDRVVYLQAGRIAAYDRTGPVLEKFTADMDATARPHDADATDFSRNYGSGKVSITAARFRDAAGTVVTAVSSGAALTLELEYQCADSGVHDALLDVVARDREGILFQATNLDAGQRLGPLDGHGRLTVTFSSFPASAGRLQFNVALLDPESKEVFDWKRNIPLEFLGRVVGPGRIDIPCRWSNERS